MLERLAQAAAFDQFAQGIGLHRREHAVEIQVQFHARQLEEMREQQFSLQTWRLDIFFAEELRAFLNRFEDGHTQRLNGGFVPRQPADFWSGSKTSRRRSVNATRSGYSRNSSFPASVRRTTPGVSN